MTPDALNLGLGDAPVTAGRLPALHLASVQPAHGGGLDNRRANLQKVNRSDHMLIHNAPQENGNGSVVCWKCGNAISPDDRCDDDKCVLSRKGLRHVECAP